MLTEIGLIIANCDSEQPNIRPTEIYNEGWMLRLVLNWFSRNREIDHQLSFLDGSRWYSEVLLPTQFKKIPKGESSANVWNLGVENESHTNADGAIGHFDIGTNGRKGDLALKKEAKQFIVVEAKMYSGLSAGTTKDENYNQAARNVACMAEVLCQKKMPPSALERVRFYVTVPEKKIGSVKHDIGAKDSVTINDSIGSIVQAKIERHKKLASGKSGLENFEKCFQELIKIINIDVLSWEDIIKFITENDPCYGTRLDGFYKKCKRFNRPGQKK
jgi:hypothetical protein